jgi:hypothetical protein
VLRSTTLYINCGEHTCADEPGRFCRFVGTKHFGQKHVCMFPFGDPGEVQELHDKDGWLQRLDICKLAFGMEK